LTDLGGDGQAATYSPKRTAEGYLSLFANLVDSLDVDAICRAVERLRTARDRGHHVYIAGNGGSAATAGHLANDLGKATKKSGRTPFRVLSLTESVSWVTAIANDEGYDRVFAHQLENFGRRGDVLILISASGNSPNLIEAVELARSRGVVTTALVGFDGGALRELVDECLWLPTEQGQYGLVESGHTVLCDILTTCLMQDLAAPAAALRATHTEA
jgi:D-sedoheptulose 7-phosphate isomerase